MNFIQKQNNSGFGMKIVWFLLCASVLKHLNSCPISSCLALLLMMLMLIIDNYIGDEC